MDRRGNHNTIPAPEGQWRTYDFSRSGADRVAESTSRNGQQERQAKGGLGDVSKAPNVQVLFSETKMAIVSLNVLVN